jgi:predicted DNA-binding transcriptional regulator YafY
MLEYLSSGRKYSISELAEKLEVTPRMIRVYKDEIEQA